MNDARLPLIVQPVPQTEAKHQPARGERPAQQQQQQQLGTAGKGWPLPHLPSLKAGPIPQGGGTCWSSLSLEGGPLAVGEAGEDFPDQIRFI